MLRKTWSFFQVFLSFSDMLLTTDGGLSNVISWYKESKGDLLYPSGPWTLGLKNDLLYIHMWSEFWELFNDFKFVLAMNDDFLGDFCCYFKFPTTHNIQPILKLRFPWALFFFFFFFQFCSVTKLASLPTQILT